MTKLSDIIRRAAPNYKQIRHYLCDDEGGCCVIGMLCLEAGVGSCDTLTEPVSPAASATYFERVVEQLALKVDDPRTIGFQLIDWNDTGGLSFLEIADILAEQGQ